MHAPGFVIHSACGLADTSYRCATGCSVSSLVAMFAVCETSQSCHPITVMHTLTPPLTRDMFLTGEICTALKSNLTYLDVTEPSPTTQVRWQVLKRMMEAADAVHEGIP